MRAGLWAWDREPQATCDSQDIPHQPGPTPHHLNEENRAGTGVAARLMPQPESSGESTVAKQVQDQGGKSAFGSGFRTAQSPERYRQGHWAHGIDRQRYGCRGTGHINSYGLAQASTEGEVGSCQLGLVRAIKARWCTQGSDTPSVLLTLHHVCSDKWLGCAMHRQHFALKPKLKPDSSTS